MEEKTKEINKKVIVFCGPPHSGKTVLINYIYEHLPKEYTAIVGTAPDGEGRFTNNENQEQIQAARRKGSFTENRTKNYLERIQNETAPIVLVDVGGKISDENRKFFELCDYSIVISNNIQDKKEWEDFCKEYNVKPIASLDSSLTGEDEIYASSNKDTITGKITKLERGVNKTKSKIINAILDKIKSFIPRDKTAQKGYEYLQDENTINVKDIAKEINMIYKDDQDKDKWNEEKSPELYSALKETLQNKEKANFFEARINWVVGLCTEAAKKSGIEDIGFYDASKNAFNHPKKAELNVIQNSSKLANNTYLYNVLNDDKLNLVVSSTENKIFLDFELNTDYKIVPEDFENMKFPDIDPNKELYISGKLPTWLFSSINLSYDNQEKYVCQLGNSFIKYASKNEKELGTEKKSIEDIDVNKVFSSYKEFLEDNIKNRR